MYFYYNSLHCCHVSGPWKLLPNIDFWPKSQLGLFMNSPFSFQFGGFQILREIAEAFYEVSMACLLINLTLSDPALISCLFPQFWLRKMDHLFGKCIITIVYKWQNWILTDKVKLHNTHYSWSMTNYCVWSPHWPGGCDGCVTKWKKMEIMNIWF